MGRDYLDVEYVGGVICLKPVDMEERIPKEDLEKLKKKALEQESGEDETPAPNPVWEALKGMNREN